MNRKAIALLMNLLALLLMVFSLLLRHAFGINDPDLRSLLVNAALALVLLSHFFYAPPLVRKWHVFRTLVAVLLGIALIFAFVSHFFIPAVAEISYFIVLGLLMVLGVFSLVNSFKIVRQRRREKANLEE